MSSNNNISATTNTSTKEVKKKKQSEEKPKKINKDRFDNFTPNLHIPSVNVTMNRNPTGGHVFSTRFMNFESFVTGLVSKVIGFYQGQVNPIWTAHATREFFNRLVHFSMAVKIATTSDFLDVGSSPIISLLRRVDLQIPTSIKGFCDGIGSFTLDHARFRMHSALIHIYTHFYLAVGVIGQNDFEVEGFDYYIPRTNYSNRVVRELIDFEYKQSFNRQFPLVFVQAGVPHVVGNVPLPYIPVVNQHYLGWLQAAGYAVADVAGKLALLVAIDGGAIDEFITDVQIPLVQAARIKVIEWDRFTQERFFNNFINSVAMRSEVMSAIFDLTVMKFESNGSPGQLLSTQQGLMTCPFNIGADDLSYGYMVGANCTHIEYNEYQHNIQFDTYTSGQLMLKFIQNDKAKGQ